MLKSIHYISDFKKRNSSHILGFVGKNTSKGGRELTANKNKESRIYFGGLIYKN